MHPSRVQTRRRETLPVLDVPQAVHQQEHRRRPRADANRGEAVLSKMSQDTQYTLVHMRYSVTWCLRVIVCCVCMHVGVCAVCVYCVLFIGGVLRRVLPHMVPLPS